MEGHLPRLGWPDAVRTLAAPQVFDAVSEAFDAVSHQMTQTFEQALQQAVAHAPARETDAGPVMPEAVTVAYGAGGPVWGMPRTQPGDVAALEGLGAVPVKPVAGTDEREVALGVTAGVARWRPLMEEISARHGVSPDLVASIVRQESGGNPDAQSPVGAQGLMQLMPVTAREMGVTDPFDPAQNLEGGTRYLRQMLDMFNGDVTLAVAAYNAGPGQVRRHGGVPPFEETRRYVERVLAVDTGS